MLLWLLRVWFVVGVHVVLDVGCLCSGVLFEVGFDAFLGPVRVRFLMQMRRQKRVLGLILMVVCWCGHMCFFSMGMSVFRV